MFSFLLLIADAIDFLVQIYIVSLRHADTSGVLSASTAERDCLMSWVQELENELSETKVQLSKALRKSANLFSR